MSVSYLVRLTVTVRYGGAGDSDGRGTLAFSRGLQVFHVRSPRGQVDVTVGERLPVFRRKELRLAMESYRSHLPLPAAFNVGARGPYAPAAAQYLVHLLLEMTHPLYKVYKSSACCLGGRPAPVRVSQHPQCLLQKA